MFQTRAEARHHHLRPPVAVDRDNHFRSNLVEVEPRKVKHLVYCYRSDPSMFCSCVRITCLCTMYCTIINKFFLLGG